MPARDESEDDGASDLLKEAAAATLDLLASSGSPMPAEDLPGGVPEARTAPAAPDPPAPAPGDEPPQRDSMVPRGTFASEGPPELEPAPERIGVESASKSGAREREAQPEPAEGVALVAQSKAANNSQRLRVARAPERPPYLASEILKEDLTPREPGAEIGSAVIMASASVGLASVLGGGFESLPAAVLSLVFVLLFAAGRVQHASMTYLRRASAVLALAAAGLAAVEYRRFSQGAPSAELLLALSTTLLPAALYTRAWYRGSLMARVLVGLSLAPAFGWGLANTHRELLSLAFEWESWLPALSWCLFAILCLLALLAFMGSETTGGCTAWAIGMGVWYALFAGVRYALETGEPTAMRTLGLVAPALAAPLAVALAQLFARTIARRL